MGILVDNTSSRWGKFKPWIIAGTILNILVVLALFNTPTNVSEIWQFVYITIFYLLWCMTYTMMDVPFWSMLPALSSDKQEREEIVPFPRIFASLAWLSLGSFGLYAVSHFGGGNEELGFSRLALVVSVFFMISSLITVFFCKRKTTTNRTTKSFIQRLLQICNKK
jgi:melibiose permease